MSHLRGEFAIALLDQRNEVLYLVRDRFGIKPLFYSRLNDSLVFGSEIKAILGNRKVRARLDHVSLFYMLQGQPPPETTCFENIRTVEPGCMLRISRSAVTRRRYWDLPLGGEVAPASEEEAIEEFRRLFYEAVRLRLHGDVEVGAYVSGGLDSTSVAATAAEVSGRPVKAFTVEFDNKKLNEGEAAAEFAQARGFEHLTIRIGPGDLAPHFERSLWHSEIAVGNSHGAAKMILSELARRHVKVVLTGEGADEALAGYNVFQHIALLEEVRTHPRDRERRAALETLLRKEKSGIALLQHRDVTDTSVARVRSHRWPIRRLSLRHGSRAANREKTSIRYVRRFSSGGRRDRSHWRNGRADRPRPHEVPLAGRRAPILSLQGRPAVLQPQLSWRPG